MPSAFSIRRSIAVISALEGCFFKCDSMKSFNPRWSSSGSARLAMALTSIVTVYVVSLFCTSPRDFSPLAATSGVTWSDLEEMDEQLSELGEDAPESKAKAADYGRVSNRTLGFQTVIAVGLQARSINETR